MTLFRVYNQLYVGATYSENDASSCDNLSELFYSDEQAQNFLSPPRYLV